MQKNIGIRKCWIVWGFCFLLAQGALAQDVLQPTGLADTPATNTPAGTSPLFPAPSVDEKWHFLIDETVSPLLLVAVIPDATVSQLTRSAPLYGKHFGRNQAFLRRLGATTGDDVSQNFFADFLLASAFHEDTRYRRSGATHQFWRRMGYAISRAVVTRTDQGAGTFNWANVLGCAMSAGLSNAYYPPVSRTVSTSVVNWGTNVAGAGLTNIMREFGPDVGRWFKRHVGFHH